MKYYSAQDLARAFRTVRNNTIKIAEDIPAEHYGFRAVAGEPAAWPRRWLTSPPHRAGPRACTPSASRTPISRSSGPVTKNS